MTQEQKIIRAKLGLLELAKQLGNVSRACKMMGYSQVQAITIKCQVRIRLPATSDLNSAVVLRRQCERRNDAEWYARFRKAVSRGWT